MILGVDIAYQCNSGYMSGHSGISFSSLAVNDEKLGRRLKKIQSDLDDYMSPFDCFFVLSSLKTFPIRMKEHSQNGLTIARFLEGHPAVEKVFHPGLQSHQQHDLFMRQSRGCSGVFSFMLKGDAEHFLRSLRVSKIVYINRNAIYFGYPEASNDNQCRFKNSSNYSAELNGKLSLC